MLNHLSISYLCTTQKTYVHPRILNCKINNKTLLSTVVGITICNINYEQSGDIHDLYDYCKISWIWFRANSQALKVVISYRETNNYKTNQIVWHISQHLIHMFHNISTTLSAQKTCIISFWTYVKVMVLVSWKCHLLSQRFYTFISNICVGIKIVACYFRHVLNNMRQEGSEVTALHKAILS